MNPSGFYREEDCFLTKDISSWDEFLSEINKLKTANWIYRGQKQNWTLKSHLERALDDYAICLNRAENIEQKMIRDFRRRYTRPDHDLVLKDSLYCLALMQHHGAPTRLIDWNYSPYIATFFALEEGLPKGTDQGKSVLWCINTDWCIKAAEINQTLGKEFIKDRSTERTDHNEERTDESFKKYYMSKPPIKFVFPENPFSLNERLRIQQGVFLCPGNISIPLEENIKSFENWREKDNIIKFRFRLDITSHKEALKDLIRMNISRESLFPGLDGFSKGFKQRLLIYDGQIDMELRERERIIA